MTTNNRLYLAVLFGLLSVVGSGSVAVGDLLLAPKDTVTVFRVQGGTSRSGAPGSRQLIDVDEFGDVSLKQTTLNVSIGDVSHAEYFQTLLPGSKITSFEIPKWMDDFIRAEAIPQKG